MPETSLRAYGREIDELIERERLDEAIAHCRYILQTYPKHLETYRHLGKAYLEAKRYGDAADIFQRVLSAVPDDFVSHVGMAIVREDEGNLDAAIWHMERAFETNPSNPAIQQEMKRLISRRDGLEPHKVRLTRGALARMYAHGELFAQAITELRSALQEDAERPDLQVLLARMYWQTDQRGDAISVSNQILEKLPYCAEANRILAANLQASDRVEEAAVYHRRLANLDPYAAFIESALSDANGVEETAVSLEKLDWVAGEPLPSAAPGQPGWAATLGMEMQEEARDESPEAAKPAQTGPLPSWLEPGEPPPFEAAAEKELREEMENQAAGDSGSSPGAGFLDDLGPETSDETGPDVTDGSGGLPEAGILDDLEAETPDDEDFSEAEPVKEDSELPEFAAAAAGIADGVLASEDKAETEDSEADVDQAAIVAGMFDQAESAETSDIGLAEAEFGATEDEPSGDVESPPIGEDVAAEGPEPDGSPGGEIPDWMQEAGWGESKGEFKDAPVSFSERELESLDAGEIPAESPEEDDVELTPAELPDWIHDIAPEEVEGGSDSVGDESLPSWIGAEAPSADGPEAPSAAEIEDSGEAKASVPASESDTGKIPTWISDEPPGATETIVTWLEDRGPDSDEGDAGASEDLPDWMRDTGPLDDLPDSGLVEAQQADVPVEMQQDETPSADVPIEAQQDETPSADVPVEAPQVEIPSADVPVEAQQDETPSADVPVEAPQVETPSADVPMQESDEAVTPAELPTVSELPEEHISDAPSSESWLSAVAAAAAEEEASPSSTDGDSGEAPDRLSEEMRGSEDPASGDEVPGLGSAADELEASETEIVEEIRASEQEIEGIAPTAEPSGSSPAPDWLKEIGTLPEQPTSTDSADWLEGLEIDGEESAAEPATATPEWLKGLAEEGAEGDESGASPAADWLREIGEPGSVSEEQAVDSPEHADQVEAETGSGAPDWLQGVDSAADEEAQDATLEADDFEVETPRAPVEEDDEVMDWLQDLAAKQAEAPDDEELEAAARVESAAPVLEDRDIPDAPEEGLEWLEQLADQRGMDVDVSVPDQTPPSPEPEPEPESDTVPGWLGRMATQPIPKVDMEALEAAARDEGVSPDAETIDAQAADIQAQLDQVSVEREADVEVPDGSTEVAPDDVTIEARASDLQAEIEREAEPVEPVAASSEGDSADEIPDWLISAAEQAEPAPSGLPAEFV
ncbi:MAG: tetratricopeptide repeat protein, partial [Anaerolineales bacterium]